MNQIDRSSRPFSRLLFLLPALALFAGCRQRDVTAGGASPASSPKAAALAAEGFKAEITLVSPPASVKAGASAVVPVKVKNVSPIPWPSNASGVGSQINLGFHWWTPDGKAAQFDGPRTNLPKELAPGAEVELTGTLTAPSAPGDYVLEADMVQEAVTWFKDKGSKTARVPVRVE